MEEKRRKDSEDGKRLKRFDRMFRYGIFLLTILFLCMISAASVYEGKTGRDWKAVGAAEQMALVKAGGDFLEKEAAFGGQQPLVELPHSAFFRCLAEQIWGKEWSEITEEEYAHLTSLQIDREEETLYYQLEGGMVESLSCLWDAWADYGDLSVFSGLRWISVDSSLKQGDLQGLNDLFGVYARNSGEELAEIIPCPEKITDLGIFAVNRGNLEDLSFFPNLCYLSVEYEALEDISALASLPGLQGLILSDCGELRDYSPLGSLTKLEWLRISSGRLEDLEFLKRMPHLACLSIEGSQIFRLEALKACPELKMLHLVGNGRLKDYSALGLLRQLQELTLEECTVEKGGEELFCLPGLHSLYLRGCRLEVAFDSLSENQTLRALALENTSLVDLSEGSRREVGLGERKDIFRYFPKLEELCLADMGLDDIQFVQALPDLQYLDITGNQISSLEALGALKNLQTVWYEGNPDLQ